MRICYRASNYTTHISDVEDVAFQSDSITFKDVNMSDYCIVVKVPSYDIIELRDKLLRDGYADLSSYKADCVDKHRIGTAFL